MKELDLDYCYQEATNTYSYENRNGTTAHVHMMLATALSYMLDSCECAFFLDTPNSVSRTEAVETTGSPWIMYEVTLMSLIRERKPNRQINFSLEELVNERQKTANAELEIDYELDLSNLRVLTNASLNGWLAASRGRKGEDALDLLYKNFS